MSRRRFSLVLTGARGEVAKTKYLDRLRGMGQGENIGTKGNRPNQIPLYIEPFGSGLPSTVKFRVSALAPSWENLKAAIGTHTDPTLNAADDAIKVGGFTAARAVRRTIDTTGTATPSKLTGLKYLKYNVTSCSAPFGRKNATEKEAEAQAEIRGLITTTFKCSFIQERM